MREEILEGDRLIKRGSIHRGVPWDRPAGPVEAILYCNSGYQARGTWTYHFYKVITSANGYKRENMYQITYQGQKYNKHHLYSIKEIQ